MLSPSGQSLHCFGACGWNWGQHRGAPFAAFSLGMPCLFTLMASAGDIPASQVIVEEGEFEVEQIMDEVRPYAVLALPGMLKISTLHATCRHTQLALDLGHWLMIKAKKKRGHGCGPFMVYTCCVYPKARTHATDCPQRASTAPAFSFHSINRTSAFPIIPPVQIMLDGKKWLLPKWKGYELRPGSSAAGLTSGDPTQAR